MQNKEQKEKKVNPMDSFKFVVTPGPHLNSGNNTQNIMLWVLIALAPVTIAALVTFKLAGLLVMTMTIIGAVGAEALLQKLNKQKITILDGSAAVTGLLLALTLPPKLPWWIPLIGGFIAIALAKYIFGGLGFNIFNPALVARAVLVVSWPAIMTTSYLQPYAIDAKTSASPLFIAKQVGLGELPNSVLKISQYIEAFLFTNKASVMGEVSVVLVVFGGLILIFKKIINWRIPAFYIGTVALLTFLNKGEVVFYLFAGGLMIGAFFMATDYVTSAVTKRGKIIFAIGAGFITWLIRFYTNLPEGVMFAILFMNSLVPLIDRFTMPRIFGKKKVRAEA